MADPLPKTNHEPQYLKYFGMPGAPFARLGSARDLYLTEQYSFLLAHLANATEQADSLILICGQNGSGKTSLLNRFITSIDENICFASINEFCNSETDFFLSTLRQFGFGEISGTIDELRYITHEFLIQQGKAGDPVLLLVDNAHLLSPSVFEQLRWIVSIKYNDLAVTNIILAGNPELARIMESPAMSQISARNHVRFNIRAYTEEETANYIWHRLDLVNSRQAVQFSADVHPLIYRYTGGIPRLINVLCDAALHEALNQKSKTVTGEMLRRAAKKHRLVPHAVPLQSKSRRKTDPGFQPPVPSEVTELVQGKNPGVPNKPGVDKPQSTNEAKAATPGGPDRGAPTESSGEPVATTATPDPELLKKLTALSKQLKKFKVDAEQTQSDLTAKSALVAELESKLEDKTHALEVLATDLESGSSESNSLRASIEKLTRRLERQDRAMAKLAADLADRRNIIGKLEAELSDKNEKTLGIAGLEEACRSAQQQLLDREHEATALRSELSILKRKETDLAAQLEIATGRLSELGTLKKAIVELEAEAANRSEELSNFRRMLSEQESRADAFANQLRTSESRCRTLEDQAQHAAQLEARLIERDGRIEDLQNALTGRDEELTQIKGHLEEKASTITSLEAELSRAARLAADLERQIKENQELTETIAAKDEELHSLQAVLNDHAEIGQLHKAELARIGNLELKLEEAAQTAAALHGDIEAREETITALHAELSESKEENRWLKSDIHRLRDIDEQLVAQSSRNQELESEIAGRENRIAELTDELGIRMAELEAAHTELGQLKETRGRLDSLTSDFAALEEQLATRNEEIARLQAQIAEQAELIDGLRTTNAELEDLEKARAEQAARADGLQLKLDTSEEQFRKLEAQLTQQLTLQDAANQKIAQLMRTEAELSSAAEMLEELEASLEEKSRVIAALETGLSEKDELVSALQAEAALLPEREQALLEKAEEAQDLVQQIQQKDLELDKLTEELRKQRDLLKDLSENASRTVELEEQVAEYEKTLSALESDYRQAKDALTEAEHSVADQAVELSESHALSIHASDLEEQLAEQLRINAEVSQELAREVAKVQDLEEKLSNRIPDEEATDAPLAQPAIVVADDDAIAESQGTLAIAIAFKGSIERELTLELDGLRCMIGRNEDNEISLSADTVSRHHAILSCVDGYLTIEDLNSTNGIEINSRKVMSGRLCSGDVITVGDYELRISTSFAS